MTMWRFMILFLFTLIPACQSAYINGVPNEGSPYFQVPVDSKLILNRTITIEPFQNSAYFQRGRMIPWYEVIKYGAYCALAVTNESTAWLASSFYTASARRRRSLAFKSMVQSTYNYILVTKKI